jgi:hypothetical protein
MQDQKVVATEKEKYLKVFQEPRKIQRSVSREVTYPLCLLYGFVGRIRWLHVGGLEQCLAPSK